MYIFWGGLIDIIHIKRGRSREASYVLKTKKKRKKNQSNRRGSRTTYQKFRTKILIRDQYKCKICGVFKEKGLRVHHIHSWETYSELRMNTMNAITLCANCHDIHVVGSFHNIYGADNNNMSEFTEYYEMRTGKGFNKEMLLMDEK